MLILIFLEIFCKLNASEGKSSAPSIRTAKLLRFRMFHIMCLRVWINSRLMESLMSSAIASCHMVGLCQTLVKFTVSILPKDLLEPWTSIFLSKCVKLAAQASVEENKSFGGGEIKITCTVIGLSENYFTNEMFPLIWNAPHETALKGRSEKSQKKCLLIWNVCHRARETVTRERRAFAKECKQCGKFFLSVESFSQCGKW